MKKGLWLFLVLCGFVFISCASYGVGGAIHSGKFPTHDDMSVQLFSSEEHTELYVGYFSGTFEESNVDGFRLGFNVKPKISFSQYFSIFPLIGLSYSYLPSLGNQFEDYQWQNFLFMNLGGGFDISLTKYMYLRSMFAYQPGWFETPEGTTLSFALGFRTANDQIRRNWKTVEQLREARIRREQQAERERQTQRERREQREQADRLAAAKREFDAKNYQTALNLYTQIIQEYSRSHTAYYGRADVYFDQGNYEAALDDFLAAARISITIPQAWSPKYRRIFTEVGADLVLAKMGNYGIFNLPRGLFLRLRENDNPSLTSAKGNGDEALLPAGRHTFTFNYTGGLRNVTTINNISVSLEIQSGRVYMVGNGFDGRSLVTTVLDVTSRELGTAGEDTTIVTRRTHLFDADRFRRGMTLSEVRQRFPSDWEQSSERIYILRKGRGGTNAHVLYASFNNGSLASYLVGLHNTHRNEVLTLLENHYGQGFPRETGEIMFFSLNNLEFGVRVVEADSVFMVEVVFLGGDQ